jgi:hydroxyquinol 1,2-dioxygenase
MREFDEKSITQAVIRRLSECDDPRFKRIMTSLITHLHDFVREVELTESEGLAAIQFLTDVGKTCTDKRQEFILLSDTLGVSVLVVTLSCPADQGSVESTVLGPFYWQGAPDLPRGSNLAERVKGEPTFYSGWDACSWRWVAIRIAPATHLIVSAPGHLPVTTHLFVAGSQYLDSDAVFGMKESLVAQFDRHPPGIGPNGERMDTPFYTVNYDFRLRPAGV